MHSLGRRALHTSAAAYAASLVPRPPETRFVIVCLPRSGSELLVDLLGQLPGVVSEGELLQQPVLRPVPFLEGRARLGRARGARAWGCKLLVQHLQWYEAGYGPAQDVLRQLTDRGWKVLHLRRADVLSSALSALHAEQSKRWHARVGDEVTYEPVDADAAEIVAWIHAYDAYRTWLDGALEGVPHELVSYEDELRDPHRVQATLDRLAGVLGVPTAPVGSDLRPIAPSDPFARVADPEALKAVLRHTRFAHLVDG